MAEFESEATSLDLFHEMFSLMSPRHESADVNICRDVNKVGGMSMKKHSQCSNILELTVLSRDHDNVVRTQTNVVEDVEEENLYKNNVKLNNIENLKKQTLESNVNTIQIHDKTEDIEEKNHPSHPNFINGTADSVHNSDAKGSKAFKKNKKGVSFPMDTLISGYFEPPDPWKNAPTWTTDELVFAYKKSCEINATKPIAKLIQQLQATQSSNKYEELLSLKGEKLDQKQCECLEEILKRAKFKLVDLEASHLDDECAVALFDMIEYYESACQLNIAFNRNIQARGWQACSRLVRRTPNLTYLDLRSCDLNDRTIPIFGRALKLGCHLTILHMESMNLSGRPLLILVTALKTNETLQELFLAENKLMPTDGVHLGSLLCYNHKLSLLDLRNNHLQDVGTSHICEGLVEQTKGTGLRTLVLWNNFISYQAMSILGKALACSQSMETLNIGHNAVTNEGAHLLKDGLLRVNTLLRLGLQGTRISDEGAVALAEFIAESTVLLRIDLRDNDIKTGGLMALSHAMRVNTSVTRIDLDKEPKKEPGIKDYIEQQTRLLNHILTFQQRNVQIAINKELQERAQLIEKDEADVAAVKEEAEIQHQAGTLPANSSTESFTLIEEMVEKGAAEEEIHEVVAENDNTAIAGEGHVSFEEPNNVELHCPPHEEDRKSHQRPCTLFHELPLHASQVSEADDDQLTSTIYEACYECPQPSSQKDVPTLAAAGSTPAEMILSPQYFPKQIARKIFSVIRVSETASCPQLPPSPTLSHPVSYDPLSVSAVPLLLVSSLPSLSLLSSSATVLRCAEGVPQHSKIALQVSSPSTVLFHDLAEETMRHMVSPDIAIRNSIAKQPEHDRSQRSIDNTVIDDFASESGIPSTLEDLITGVELSSFSEVEAPGEISPVQHSDKEVCDYLDVSEIETEGSKISATSPGNNVYSVHSGKQNLIVRNICDAEEQSGLLLEEEGCGLISDEERGGLRPEGRAGALILEEKRGFNIPEENIGVYVLVEEELPKDADSLQLKSPLPDSLPGRSQYSSNTCFVSQEHDLTLAGACGSQYVNDGDIKEDDDAATQTGIFQNDTMTVCEQEFPETSIDSPFVSIEESSESDPGLHDSEVHTAAYLQVGAHNDLAHIKEGILNEDSFDQHLRTSDGIKNFHNVVISTEKQSSSIVTDGYNPEEPMSFCLNNFSSPALLVSEDPSSASLPEKSVISQYASCSSEEHSFSSIVDLLRLDKHDSRGREDRQIDAGMSSLRTSDDSPDDLVSANVVDIETVDFSLDEEPWLTVGVEVDGGDAEASKKSLKQPDFFTTLSMNGLTQELASALTSLDGSTGPFEVEDYDLGMQPHDEFEKELDAMLAVVQGELSWPLKGS